MPELTSELSRKNRRSAYISWGNTKDRTARTANARKGFEEKFLREADGDPLRAEALRKAFYIDLINKSVETRKRRRQAAEEARRQAIAELIAGGDAA
jgi:hypothetical protein